MKAKWEVIEHSEFMNAHTGGVERMRIPGGWLYKRCLSRSAPMTFVPEADDHTQIRKLVVELAAAISRMLSAAWINQDHVEPKALLDLKSIYTRIVNHLD